MTADAVSRADKWHYALGPQSPGKDYLFQRIMRGEETQEEKLQDEINRKQDEIVKQEILHNVLTTRTSYTQEDLDFVRNLASSKIPERSNFFPTAYANRLLNDAISPMIQGTPKVSERDYESMDVASRVMSLKEGVQRMLEDYDARWKAQEWPEKAASFAGQWVPLLQGARLRDSFWGLTGNDLTQQYIRALQSPDVEGTLKQIKAKADELFQSNPITAREYLAGFIHYSATEAAAANLWSAVDFATAPGVGLAAKAVKGTTTSSARILSNIVKANNGTKAADAIDIAAATGRTLEAGAADAQQQLMKKAENQGILPVNGYAELAAQTPTLVNAVANVTRGVRAEIREVSQRIQRNLEYGKQWFEQNLLETPKTRRLDPDSAAKKVADAETDAMFRIEYPHLSDYIIDVRSSNLEDTVTSNWFRYYRIGRDVSQDSPVKSAALGTLEKNADVTVDLGKAANSNAGRKPELVATGSKKTEDYGMIAGNDNIKTTMGRYDLAAFETKEAAERTAREDWKLKSFRVVEHGDGFAIELTKAVDEKALTVRNMLTHETLNVDPPTGFMGKFWQAIESNNPSALLRGVTSKGTRFDDGLMREAQTVSFQVHPTQELVNAVVAPIVELRSGNAKEWKEFKTLLERQRVQYNKDTGKLGVFSNDMGELDAAYMKNFNRPATAAEHAAYWSYRQLNDIDYVTRNLQLYTQKVSQGRQMISLASDLEIEGKTIKNLPFDSDVNAGVAIWNKDPDAIQFTSLKGMRAKERDALKDQIESGKLKVVQIPQDTLRQLKEHPTYRNALKEDNFYYILTESYETRPLDWKQVPYREGGHHVNEYSYFLRSPDLKPLTRGERNWVSYLGDINIHGFMNKADGEMYAKRFNEARQLLRESGDDLSAVSSYLNSNLPYSTESFKKFFDRWGGPLRLDQEVYLTPANQNVDKTHKLEDVIKRIDPNVTYVRASENPHNLDSGNTWTKFVTERGDPMSGVEREGSKDRPLFKVVAPKMMDPMATVMRATEDVLTSRGFDDLRVRSAERFIAEFGDVLAWDINKLRANPMQALLEAPFKPGASRAEIAAAKDFRRGAKEMLAIKSDAQANVDAVWDRLLEHMFGQSKFTGDTKWAKFGNYAISTVKEPAAALRSAAFEVKQGLFSPASFINQAMIVNHIAGIEGPVVTIRSALAANVARMVEHLDQSPKVLSHAAKMSGMSEKHFLEMWEGLRVSGFNRVGREVADRGDWLTPAMGEGAMSKFLDWGRIFFKQGEALGRYTAYTTAYNKWRMANPTAAFDDLAKSKVLQRANFLNLEMTGINNSELQKGLPGVITQFFTAHFRQAEQLLGSRLTWQEKARWATWNGVLFGLPVTAGGFTGVWPVSNSAREYVNESGWISAKGWHPNDSALMNVLMNGALSAMSEKATGMQFNTGNLSLGGASLFRDLVQGNKSMTEFLGGVSGRVFSDFWKATQPIWWAATSVGSENKYVLSWEDARDFIGNVSSMGAAEKIYSAVMLGKYFNREGVRLDNINTMQGLIAGLTGMQPQSVTNYYDMIASMKKDKEYQKTVEKQFGESVRNAFKALEINDMEGFGYFMRQANFHFVRGNFREDQRMQMVRRSVTDILPRVEKIEQDFVKQMNTPGHRERFYRQVEGKNK